MENTAPLRARASTSRRKGPLMGPGHNQAAHPVLALQDPEDNELGSPQHEDVSAQVRWDPNHTHPATRHAERRKSVSIHARVIALAYLAGGLFLAWQSSGAK